MPSRDRIGLSLWTMQSTAARPGLWRALYRRLGEDARLAEELGFHAVWLGEHRVWYDGWCPAPLQALAHVAGSTSTIHLGTAMYLVPQHDPVAAARSIATLDHLSGRPGRARRRARLPRRRVRRARPAPRPPRPSDGREPRRDGGGLARRAGRPAARPAPRAAHLDGRHGGAGDRPRREPRLRADAAADPLRRPVPRRRRRLSRAGGAGPASWGRCARSG